MAARMCKWCPRVTVALHMHAVCAGCNKDVWAFAPGTEYAHYEVEKFGEVRWYQYQHNTCTCNGSPYFWHRPTPESSFIPSGDEIQDTLEVLSWE